MINYLNPMKPLQCPYCGKPAIFSSNDIVYGRRYGKSYMCYYCKDCDAYVGTHNNTDQPLGTMANKKLRKLRIIAHSLFDPLWQTGKMKRKQAYKFLEKNTGVKHISWTNEEQCKKVIEFLQSL